MQEEHSITTNKKISEQSQRLLQQIGKLVELVPAVYASLKQDGFTPYECRKMIEERIAISQTRLRELLPTEAKQQSKVRPTSLQRIPLQISEREIEKPVYIPPPKQEIREIEPIPFVQEEEYSVMIPSRFKNIINQRWHYGDVEVRVKDGKVVKVL